MYNIFIDGKEGTTGLQIYDRLSVRNDVKIISLSEELRKDADARRECLNKADISFLCLPDAAAKEAVEMVDSPAARIIDASTAHRTSDGWIYGLPEISAERRAQIASAKRVANPGCYATGFITLVAPLINADIVGADYPFVCHALSGYSGAGKKGIAQYESGERSAELDSPRHYALGQHHKHLPEMVQQCGLSLSPIFSPIICDYYAGMCVCVPLHKSLMTKKYGVNALREYFAEYYVRQNYIKIVKENDIPDYLASNRIVGTNELEIYICGSDDKITLFSVFDNLGKGASGAAVQNMNIMLGLDETTFLS